MTHTVKEGWYEDPARRHQYRWFSDGTPTDLVRNGGKTFRDAISMADASLYQSMDLEQPPDVSPPVYRPDDRPPRFEVLNFGRGPVSVVNTAADSDPRSWSQPASGVEILLVLFPVLVGVPIGLIVGAPVIVVLGLVLMSLLAAVLGARRRRRRARSWSSPRTPRAE
jgi:hypothetical protein